MYDLIKELCKSKAINTVKLESELGFANGTINKWDTSQPSAGRLKAVADYFGVSMEYLMTGEEKQPTPEGELSELAIKIGKLVDMLPDQSRQSLLVQIQALVLAQSVLDDPSKSE